MYEDRTYENIMAEMMEESPNGVDTSEGSFYWFACGKAAMEAETIYSNMEEIYANMMIDTADLDHLIAAGSEMGCPIIEATAARFKAKFNMPVDIGTEMQYVSETDDLGYLYTVDECIDEANHIYLIECETDGIEPNSYLGSVEPVDYIDGFEGEITELYTAGTDEEDQEVYRYRLMDFFKYKAFAGNNAYYKQEVDAMSGVGGCKASRASAPGSNVSVVIISSAYTVPSSELIATVQKDVDPIDKSGDGDGIAPTCAKVIISGVKGSTINISAKFTFESGKTYDDIKSYIEAAIDAYFVELGKGWEDSTVNLTVRLSQIEYRLLNVTGVVDVESITINDNAANLTLGDNEIPVRGTITCI